jgi:hypothetical protein
MSVVYDRKTFKVQAIPESHRALVCRQPVLSVNMRLAKNLSGQMLSLTQVEVAVLLIKS